MWQLVAQDIWVKKLIHHRQKHSAPLGNAQHHQALALASVGQLQWTARTYNLAIVSLGYISKKLGTSQAKELRTVNY